METNSLELMLVQHQLAVFLNVRLKDLERECDEGRGPRAVEIAGCLRYQPREIQRWLNHLAENY